MASTFVDASNGSGATVPAVGAKGDQLVVKVGTVWPDVYFVKLVSDGARWIQGRAPLQLIGSIDGFFMLAQQTEFSYLGVASGGFAATWLRAGGVMYARELIAAGLRLQDRIVARMLDPGAGVNGTLSVLWYPLEHGYTGIVGAGDPGADTPAGSRGAHFFDNDGASDTLTTLWPGATWNGRAVQNYPPSPQNVGFGAVLDSGSTGAARFYGAARYATEFAPYAALAARAPAWDDVKLFRASSRVGSVLGGVPTATPATLTSRALYPTLYAKVSAAGQQLSVAAIAYWTRWVA